MQKAYNRILDEIVPAVTALAGIAAVVTKPLAVEAGLTARRAGGDFAAGVIVHQAASLDGSVFAGIDRTIVTLPA